MMMLVGVDAGGSRTVAVVEDGAGDRHTLELPSISPAAVGEAAAMAAAEQLFLHLASMSGEANGVTGCIGCASATPHTLDAARSLLAVAAERAGLAVDMLLAEDATITLAGPPLNGVGILSIVGTGSITLGRSPAGRFARCGGYEYLVSDEGSGFDLGMAGLRAAGRAHDGRGPVTRLTGAARQRYGLDMPALGDALAALPHPKSEVACFARDVCELAADGDEIAAGIVAAATADIVSGVSAAALTLGVPSPVVAFSGGVVRNSAYFARVLFDRLARAMPYSTASIITDPVLCALELARRYTREGPSIFSGLPCAQLRTE